MKKRVSILEESFKKLILYATAFFTITFIMGFLVIKINYDEEISLIDNAYNDTVNISKNKLIQEEVLNIKKYLKSEYVYLEQSHKEMVDSAYLLIKDMYKTHYDKDAVIRFITQKVKFPLKVEILNGIDVNFNRYARYLEITNDKILKISIDLEKYIESRDAIALKNIPNLHNYHLSNFEVTKLDNTYNFLDEEQWYCLYESNEYNCYDKLWMIKLSFSVNDESIKDNFDDLKVKRLEVLITQAMFFLIVVLGGFILLSMYMKFKKNDINKHIELASKYFEFALTNQSKNFSRGNNINKEFTYIEFRRLSYALLRFIRQIQNKDSDIKRQVYYDNLTGLMNMNSIKDVLNIYELGTNKKLLFCFFNIMSFRSYNDMYGRAFGDELLKIIGYRLYATLKDIVIGDNEYIEALEYISNKKYYFKQNRTHFECLARISADEFLLILEVDENEDCVAIAKKYYESVVNRSICIESNYGTECESFKINARVGYSIYPQDSDNILECINHADSSIDNELAKGKDGIFGYTKEIGNQKLEDLRLQEDIKKGILNKEFILYYQPKVNCITGKIVGAEALVRWNKNGTIIMPDKFIDVCERSNLIISLGNEIIKMACDAQRRWCEMGLNIKLSINLSTKQLLNENIINTIRKYMKDLDPSLLEFEITESFSVENATSKSILDKIKALKVGISMDDFGKGYSSLSYLNDESLKFDVVKIDKCFIQDLHKNEKNRKLVEFIVNIIKSLNKKTVAEGVENKEILDFLQKLGCDEYQGYYFSKPVPEKELLERIKDVNN